MSRSCWFRGSPASASRASLRHWKRASRPSAVFCLRYFCSPYHRDSALYPVIDKIGRTVGFARDDPPVAKVAKLEALLSGVAPAEEDVALLADLISLPASERMSSPFLRPPEVGKAPAAAACRVGDTRVRAGPQIAEPLLIAINRAVDIYRLTNFNIMCDYSNPLCQRVRSVKRRAVLLVATPARLQDACGEEAAVR